MNSLLVGSVFSPPPDSCQLLTQFPVISLSQGNTKSALPKQLYHDYFPHSERINETCQELCLQASPGRYCWETEWSYEVKGVDIGVAYKGNKRKGIGCRLGLNDQSWSLSCNPEGCSFRHSNNKTNIPSVPGN